MSRWTPMIEQYLKLKREHKDAILLFRMGDFYEMFFEDARAASEILGLTLTSRNHGKSASVPLAGIPHHALERYLARLIKAGKRVAICEQMEDARQAKGIVKRDVVEVVSPGTAIWEGLLDQRRNNFLFGISSDLETCGLSVVDLSTGEFSTAEIHTSELWEEIERVSPAEVLVSQSWADEFGSSFEERFPSILLTRAEDYTFSYDFAYDLLKEHFGVTSLKGFDCDDLKSGVCAAGATLNYLRESQKTALSHISSLSRHRSSEHMILDPSTQRNLELVSSLREGRREGTLLWVLDRTKTPMGARMLKGWLSQPLRDVRKIQERLGALEELLADSVSRSKVVDVLRRIGDLERMMARVCCGRANPRDLVGLKNSLRQIPLLKQSLEGKSAEILRRAWESQMPDLQEVVGWIEEAIVDDPPLSITEGGIIKDGYDEELDRLREISSGGKSWIAGLQAKERSRTGISSLKVGYNRVFGYFIEVTKPNLDKVPSDYLAKQTLVNAERFITPELKEWEAKILGAEERIKELERDLFVEIRSRVAERAREIQTVARAVACVDVLTSLADVALSYDYVRPQVDESDVIEISDGRHPAVERLMGEGEFVPNDAHLDASQEQILIITGPNMSGKCLLGNTLIFTDRGLVPIVDLMPNGDNVGEFTEISCQVRGLDGRRKVTHFYKGGREATVKLTTRLGYHLEGTPEHRVWVRYPNGSEGWKRLGDIAERDVVAIERQVDLWGQETAIDRSAAESLKRVRRYRLPDELDEDLAYMMGLLVGDGTLTYPGCFALSTNDVFIADEYRRIVNDLFGYQVGCKANGKDYFVTSKQIRVFLASLGLGYDRAHEKHVPQSILRAPKHTVIAFLQGLFDADGFVDNRYGNVRLSTASIRLAREVQLLLLNLGIIASLRVKKTLTRPSYRLSINGADAIAFHQQVGFRLPRKRARKALASDLRMPNIGGIPYLEGTLGQVQARIVAAKDKPVALKRNKSINSIFYTYIPSGRNISYDKLDELIDYCHQSGVECPELEALQTKHYFYDRVTAVEVGEADVYDLSVAADHAYVANGFVSHNSTYLRQVGLIVLLAQIGSFVPAKSARIGVVDRIFTRIGASDSLAWGESTFLVEMNEAANILNNATDRSLVLLDEVGRGTSTFDGLSIAWAVTEHLHNSPKAHPRTLVATHYHELTELESTLSRVKNYNVAVRERDGQVIFLRKVVPGGCDRSYGIQVARLAGLPPEVIRRASEVLAKLEDQELVPDRPSESREMNLFEPPDTGPAAEHPVIAELQKLDLSSTTPLEALIKLHDWKRRLEEGGS